MINKRIKIIKENRRTTHFSNNYMKNNIKTWKTIAYSSYSQNLKNVKHSDSKVSFKTSFYIKTLLCKESLRDEENSVFIKYLVKIVTCHTLV